MTLTALRLTLLPPRAAEAGGLIAVDLDGWLPGSLDVTARR